MDIMIALLVLFGSIVGGIAANIFASELYDRAPTLAHWLIDRATLRLPEKYRARYREEWLAHLRDCPGKLGQILHALGCYKATLSLRRFSRRRSVLDVVYVVQRHAFYLLFPHVYYHRPRLWRFVARIDDLLNFKAPRSNEALSRRYEHLRMRCAPFRRYGNYCVIAALGIPSLVDEDNETS